MLAVAVISIIMSIEETIVNESNEEIYKLFRSQPAANISGASCFQRAREEERRIWITGCKRSEQRNTYMGVNPNELIMRSSECLPIDTLPTVHRERKELLKC